MKVCEACFQRWNGELPLSLFDAVGLKPAAMALARRVESATGLICHTAG
jgi:hypothetical protein